MTFTHKKGHHRARPIYWLCWWRFIINKIVKRKVFFDFSCKYELTNGDQYDVNKLFGLSFGNVHKNSARFGWCYAKAVEKFFLYAYCYVDGERQIYKICECVANHYYTCHLRAFKKYYFFQVFNEKNELIGHERVIKDHHKLFCILLGPYFGGNNPTPHDMIIELKKV